MTFLKSRFTSCKAKQLLWGMELQEKDIQKSNRKSAQKESTGKSCLLILDLQPFRSQVKRKHSIGREFQSRAVGRKKLLTQTSLSISIQEYGQKNQGICQNNEQTSLENKEVEPVEPVQMIIYRSNTYGKDLSRLHFNDEPRVKEKQQVQEQQS